MKETAMKTRMKVTMMCTALAASGTGCLEEAEETSEAEQELSWAQTYEHETGEAPRDLGSASTRTCFLLGVQGSMGAGEWSAWSTLRRAGVFLEDGRWIFRTES